MTGSTGLHPRLIVPNPSAYTIATANVSGILVGNLLTVNFTPINTMSQYIRPFILGFALSFPVNIAAALCGYQNIQTGPTQWSISANYKVLSATAAAPPTPPYLQVFQCRYILVIVPP
jgi:hypothetical protein